MSNTTGATCRTEYIYPYKAVGVSVYLFLFSNFSLFQPNVMKLIHKAYYHKIQIKLEFWFASLLLF